MNLSKYLTKNQNEVSVLKNVPIEHLKEVQQKVGTMVKVMNHYSSICNTKVRYVFRGPKFPGTASTLKQDAKTVSVYFDVKATCPGISNESVKILRKKLMETFSEMV